MTLSSKGREKRDRARWAGRQAGIYLAVASHTCAPKSRDTAHAGEMRRDALRVQLSLPTWQLNHSRHPKYPLKK